MLTKYFIIFFCLILCWETSSGSLLQLGLFGPPDDRLVRVKSFKYSKVSKNKHAILDFVGIVEHHGYPAEEHMLTTPDGYNLRIHRISGSPLNPKASGKPVVFVQHGMLCSSDVFAIAGPEDGLVYLLADRGYDVWVGNVRGNVYGRSHVKFSPDHDEQFWKFSFHEMGMIDISSNIDYILNETGQTSLIYIGHSLGTTMSYILLSSKPEYNKKIRLVVSLAPSAFFKHGLPGWLQFILDNRRLILKLSESLGIYEVLPQSYVNVIMKEICQNGSPWQEICTYAYFNFSGWNPQQLNTTLLPTFLYYTPAGTSVQVYLHFVQNILAGEFQPFDYGMVKNYLVYNQTKPPRYNLNRISAPIAIFYSSGDATCLEVNLPDLIEQLPNVVACEKIADIKFGHLDFLHGRNVKRVLNDPLLQFMENINLRNF